MGTLDKAFRWLVLWVSEGFPYSQECSGNSGYLMGVGGLCLTVAEPWVFRRREDGFSWSCDWLFEWQQEKATIRERGAREIDREVDRDTGIEASLDDARAAATLAQAAAAATATALSETGSAFESPGLERVEEAIARRLRNEEVQPGPADGIAARMDLAVLGRSLLNIFR